MEKKQRNIKFKRPCKNIITKNTPTINLEYDYKDKGIDLPKVISNSPYLIGKQIHLKLKFLIKIMVI